MKKRLWANSALLSTLLALGCQQSSAPAPGIGHASGTSQSAAESQAARPPSTEAADAGRDNADQPDDPGLTTAHDKTLRQEQPSGDESSRAAPNDGDAEPPQ